MHGPRHVRARVFASAIVFAGCAAPRSPVAESKTPPDRATVNTSASGEPSNDVDGNAASGDARGAASTPLGEGMNGAPSTASSDRAAIPPASAPVVDEPIYFPGARTRPKGSAVEASRDDEIVATWNRGGLSSEPTNGSKGKPIHAAPRVKVDVTEVRGDASEADIQRVARLKSYWPFRICYEQGLRRMQKLHGTIKLRLTIGPAGHPTGVQQLATELGDAAVVSCVVKSAMGLGLPAPSSGTPQITLDISLWPGDEPVTVKTALRGKNATPAEATAMVDQLRMHLTEVRTCYAAGLGRHEGLWGRLALALRIASGVVDEVNEIESHFPDAEVTECVRKVFLRATLPSSEREITIVYPLRLGRAPDARDARR